jgi:hypothetical protein
MMASDSKRDSEDSLDILSGCVFDTDLGAGNKQRPNSIKRECDT